MKRNLTAIEKEKVILDFKNSKAKAKDFANHVGISYQSLIKWTMIYDKEWLHGLSGAKIHENKRIKELEKENKKLKQLLREKEIQKEMLKMLERKIDQKK